MVSDRLRQVRKEHKLTQQNIADVLGMDRTTYTFYETGTTYPSISTLYRLSEIYNVTIGFLIGVEENRPELKKKPPVVADSVCAGEPDPIAFLNKDEQLMLMCYRILDSDSRKEAVEQLKLMAKEQANKIDI